MKSIFQTLFLSSESPKLVPPKFSLRGCAKEKNCNRDRRGSVKSKWSRVSISFLIAVSHKVEFIQGHRVRVLIAMVRKAWWGSWRLCVLQGV